MIVTGILSSSAICKKLCAVQNIIFYDFIVISAVAGAIGFAGAKIFFLIDYYTPAHFFKALGYMLSHPKTSGLLSGGFVFYGGLIGGIAGYFLGVKIARCGLKTFLNTFAFAIPYVHAFGRIGCFCAGCCYGIHYDGPFALHYSHPVSDVVCGPGIFPVQLLEALLLFVFAFVVLGVICRALRQAQGPRVSVQGPRVSAQEEMPALFFLYIIFYSLIRFLLEFLRGDEARGSVNFGTVFSLSISQVVSVILFIAALTLLIFLLIKNLKTDKLKQTEIQND